ncbi:hypothetical protein GCM10027175_33050 [Hymenobacter latericoloratus]
MVEVRYNRWSAWLQVALGLVLLGTGIALSPTIAGLILLLAGAVTVHIASLRLRESDVLLRLTPERIWTKEFGWQPWKKLVVNLESDRNGYTLEIHRPSSFTPRFYARVSTLTITAKELKAWAMQFATR